MHGVQLSIEHKEIYENETKEIVEKLMPLKAESKRFKIIKSLWILRNFLFKSRINIIKFIVLGFDKMIDQLHHFPNQIYYDFDSKTWKK